MRALIMESRELESVAGEIQKRKEVGLADVEIRELVERYYLWFAECVSLLPDDLSNQFRSEYQVTFFTSKIKDFLQQPAAKNSLYSNDHGDIIPYW